jgi:hypothetical protein
MYAIRLFPKSAMYGCDTLQVTITGATRFEDGVISLAEARDWVRRGEARWIGEAPADEG